jgi:hypothetical protein
VEAIISPPDELSPQDSFVILDGNQSIITPPGVNAEFLWEAFNGGILTGPIDQPIALAQAVGQYCLTVRALSPNKAKVCSSTACVDVIAGRSTAINANKDDVYYRIWPQPVRDMLMVAYQGKTPSKESSLVIRNINGVEVMRKKWAAQTDVIDLSVSQLSDGVYMVLVIREDGKIDFVEKIILMH